MKCLQCGWVGANQAMIEHMAGHAHYQDDVRFPPTPGLAAAVRRLGNLLSDEVADSMQGKLEPLSSLSASRRASGSRRSHDRDQEEGERMKKYDPGTRAYEAARATILTRLRAIAKQDKRNDFAEMADLLADQDLPQLQTWIALEAIAELQEQIAGLPAGWAVFENGVVDVRTVHDSARGAIVNWLLTGADIVFNAHTTDREIYAAWEQAKACHPAVEVARVSIVKVPV